MMEMKKCPNCGALSAEDIAFCPACGQAIDTPPAEDPAAQNVWGGSPASGQAPSPAGWSSPAAPSTPDRTITGFHRGYATTLKVVTYLFAFGFPLVMFLALCASARGRDAGAQILLGFLGCGLMAFFLWLYGAFAAKLFDLVSKIAMFNDQLLRELRAMRKENDQ